MQQNCCTTKVKKQKTKKGIDSFLLGIIVVTVLLLGGAIFFGARLGATTQVVADSQVTTQIENTRHDWGTIDIDGGVVSKTFTIENKGSSPLKLYDVQTSCMCTTAQLQSQGRSSKRFSMHEKNGSVFEVNPGEKAELLVEFDPAFHGPSGVGPISRTVTINTNDASNPSLSFQVTATVVKQ